MHSIISKHRNQQTLKDGLKTKKTCLKIQESTTITKKMFPVFCEIEERGSSESAGRRVGGGSSSRRRSRNSHFFSVNWCSRHDFPTPMSPAETRGKQRSEVGADSSLSCEDSV